MIHPFRMREKGNDAKDMIKIMEQPRSNEYKSRATNDANNKKGGGIEQADYWR